MEEVALKPQWSDFNAKNSMNIEFFCVTQNIDFNANAFLINDLREYYKTDKALCLSVIDELALRGFYFNLNKLSNFFPLNCEYSKVIKVNKQENDNYKKIKFSLMGMPNFIQKFNVKSDMFFDCIPIEGIRRIYKNVPIDMIENELISAGFMIEEINSNNKILYKVIREGDFPKLVALAKRYNIYTINEFKVNAEKLISETLNLNKYDIQKIRDITNWFDENENIKDYRNLLIKDYFCYNKIFFEYCKEKNINKVIELLGDKEILNFEKEVVFKYNTFIDYIKAYYYFNIDNSIGNIQISEIKDFDNSNIAKTLSKNGVNSFKELLLTDLQDIKGMGKGKIKTINDTIFKYIFEPEKITEDKIPEEIYDFKIKDFLIFDGSVMKSFYEFCDKNNYIYIKDLNSIKLNELNKMIPLLGKVKVKALTEKLLNPLYRGKTRAEIIKIVFNEIINDENNYFTLLFDRVVNDITLEEIGKKRAVSRERIRQIETRSLKVYEGFSNIVFDFLYSYNEKNYIDKASINEIFNNEDHTTFIYNLLKNNSNILYRNNIEKLFLKNKMNNIERFFDDIDSFINKDSDSSVFSINEFRNKCEELINKYDYANYISFDEIQNMVESSFKKKVGNIIFKHGRKIADIYVNIVRDYYPNGVTCGEEDFENIREKYYEITGIRSELSNRNLSAAISRDEKIIICGSNKYIHIDNVKVSNQLIEAMHKYINHLFLHEDLNSVFCDKIFQVFEEELSFWNVDNYTYLYGILRYFLNKEYDFKNFWIANKEKSEIIKDVALVDYLKRDSNFNIGIPKEKIIPLFGLSGSYLASIINSSNEINECYNKKNLIYYKNYHLSDKLINKINEYIDSSINEQFGFISIKHLYKKFDIYFEEEGILEENTLKDALKLYIDKYYINGLYVCKEKLNEALDDQFFFRIFIKNKKIFNRKDFENYSEKKGINKVYEILKTEFNKLYQLNYSDFTSDIDIKESDIIKIYEILDKNMKENDYMLLSDLKKNGDMYKLPDIGYSWNEYLLRSILIKNISEKYKIIDIPGQHLFEERAVIVKKNFEINNYIDLLIEAYKRKQLFNLDSVNQLVKTMQAMELINETLPAEFKKKVIDDYGRLIRY